MADVDFVSELLGQVSGPGNGASMYGYEDSSGDEMMDTMISGLTEIGALTEVGAKQMKRAIKARQGAPGSMPGMPLPSPPFAATKPNVERRAPLGFIEDGSGANFFTLAAAIGATTVMRAKVSRVSHINRLLIVPSAAGAVIDSLKVGDEEQVLASGVPVELYGTSALTDTVPDNFSPIGPGLDFIVTLKNTTAVAITGTIGTKASCKR